MSGLRSVTLGTSDLSKTNKLFKNILGLNVASKNQALRFGDADLSPGTRIHFVEVPNSEYENQHIASVGLRTPTDSGLDEYQTIFKDNQIQASEITELNGNKHFNFEDNNHQIFDIYSNEHNTGVGLGTPTFDSTVNPLHQIQGLGPIIIKVNELPVTASILKNVFNLTHYAEYESTEFPDQVIQVFQIGEGGLGGELHLYQPNEPIELKEEGIVEQIEFSANSVEAFNNAQKELDDIGIPYQTLNQGDAQSLRITENSGISFIYTLEK
ncbi:MULTISPECIES: lactoylglutathione lyase [Staphylococcus]|uniref:lactoylglutathione lyase n=1 Tax=Staphylococcus TaxID=1279 RepID=UPI00069F6065|nr:MULTISPECIES: lactoylglutathione lyase [Staphylococcus]MBY6178979.1 VOC family protein [Staphylococcaceae bacterium DP2N0-1]MCH4389623.1 VOC family protein [Staphylococcus haemolyticus]MCH4403910.1 VOC family protein [Staphylococcus haemolyticus]MCH4518775.1 VOC family protein [Staphylococcus haemolyticus]MCH4535306.1 VOC family protein [Staphylococcus haemolyticus]